MRLELKREPSTAKSTPGRLFVDGIEHCYTLEDPVRTDPRPETREHEGKIYGVTAIPAGTYEVILAHSPRFGRVLPRLLDVPSFSGVLIHGGNTAENTLGCVLVAKRRLTPDHIQGSKEALEPLIEKLRAARDRKERCLLIIHPAAGAAAAGEGKA